MSSMNVRLRRAAVFAVLVFLIVMPAAAQESESNADYPTVAALNTTVIPPRDRVELAERLLGVSASDIPPTPTSAVTRKVGEKQVFTAVNSTDDVSFSVTATLRVVGEHIYLWVEDGATVSDANLQALAHDFDTAIYPNDRALWGSEANPGVDGDPHIYGLFAHNLGASTAAYFASDHTYPKAVVAVSNEHEMFFFNLDALPSEFPRTEVDSIVAHEFQHMIRFNLQINTETWLNEGFSTFTQFYLYDDLNSAVVAFRQRPNTQLDSWDADPRLRAVNYGAATMFMVYFYDRYGIDAMRALSAVHDPRGLQDVDATLQALHQPGVNDFFGDWIMANYLSDPTYMGGRYDYQGVPPLPTPQTEANVTQYPFAHNTQANQYAANYYALSNLSGVKSLDIKLNAPTTVSLIPTSATSGTHFWYSNRGDMGDSKLTHSFDLTHVTHATLNYRLWYDTEESWDWGYVEASADGGQHWSVLSTPHTTTDDPNHVSYGAGYTGASEGWVSEAIRLDAYAGKQIQVRFEMITDDAVTRPGLALDDVSIPEINYSDDFEQDDGGWQADGWILTDNRLPEQGWVQVAERNGTQTADLERWPLDSADHTVDLAQGVDQAVVAVSPFAPVTTDPMPYMLTITTSP